MDISLKDLKALLKTLKRGGASEFEYEDDKLRLRVSLGRTAEGTPLSGATATTAPNPVLPGAPERATDADAGLATITSPFVGTFYRAPAPGADPFVETGITVKQGQTLCIVEAMKLMNEIEAEYPCTILEILVENGASVEFGQKLFKVRRV